MEDLIALNEEAEDGLNKLEQEEFDRIEDGNLIADIMLDIHIGNEDPNQEV